MVLIWEWLQTPTTTTTTTTPTTPNATVQPLGRHIANDKLDSIRWFSDRRRFAYFMYWRTVGHAYTPTSLFLLRNDSAKRHILGCGEPGVRPMTPKFELRWEFCILHLSAKFRRPICNRLEVIVLAEKQTNKQTNKRHWKYPPRFGMLRRWVKSIAIATAILRETRSSAITDGPRDALHAS